MPGQIAISIWLFLALLAIGIRAVSDHVLIPGTRWFLRRCIKQNTPVYVSSRSRIQTILNALNMIKLGKLLVESDEIYPPAPAEMDLLICYATPLPAGWGGNPRPSPQFKSKEILTTPILPHSNWGEALILKGRKL